MKESSRIVVIADDITGAAEIAGIASIHGHCVRLLCAGPHHPPVAPALFSAVFQNPPCPPQPQTIVIATDTRSMTESGAACETSRIASAVVPTLSSAVHGPTASHFLLFKKTDSALRGHVVAELSALLQSMPYHRAVYLPANPSKGRTIHDGIYYIQGKPIHQTPFSYDPEFPAATSSLRIRFPDAARHHILMPDARTTDDIRRVINHYNDTHTLFAGAADLFTALISTTTPDTQQPPAVVPALFSAVFPNSQPAVFPPGSLQPPSLIIVCGSTQSQAPPLPIPVSPMPLSLYDGDTDLSRWPEDHYNLHGSVILTIPHRHRTGKNTALHLRTVIAQKVKNLVTLRKPDQLVIEGGATAWAILQTLGWTDLNVERQLAPGIVQMRAHTGTLVTLKPGSYPWPLPSP